MLFPKGCFGVRLRRGAGEGACAPSDYEPQTSMKNRSRVAQVSNLRYKDTDANRFIIAFDD